MTRFERPPVIGRSCPGESGAEIPRPAAELALNGGFVLARATFYERNASAVRFVASC